MIRAHVVLGLVFAGLLCAAPTAAAAPDTLLDFESLGEGTLVGTQGQLTFGTKTGLQFTAQPGSYDDVFAGTPSAGRPFRSCDRQLVVRAPGLRGQRRLQPQCGNLPDFGGPRDENRPAGFARFGATKSRVSLRFRPSPCVDQPPAPPFNGVPCDMRTALLAFDIHGNLLTKDVADVRGETLSVTRPVNDIAFIEVGEDGGQEPQETPIGIDDVVYDNPDVGPPPDFSLVDVSAAKPAGGTFRIALPISRINASAGAVTLSHAELPPGISSVDFDPDPSTSGATDMIVAIAPDAAPGVHQFTVTGTPAGPDAGPVARAATVRVDVKEPVRLFVDEPQPVDIYPCGSVTLHVKVAPHPDFQGGPITVTVDAVATGPLFVGDQSFTAPGDATTARDVTVSARPGASLYGAQAVTVRARVPGFPDQDLSVAVTPQAPALRSVEFVGDATPGYLSRVPGKLIGHGAGFCAGSIVEFGSPDAGGGFPTFVSANATQITSPIPPTAIPGYVAVRTPSDGTATLANVAIHGYRDLFGFAFANGGGKKFTAEDLVATFTDAGRITQICTNAGGTVTCRTSRLLSADAKGLVGRGGGGQCWGMATLSLRAQLRLWSTAGLPPSGGVPFDLKGPGGASAQLDDAIRLAQLSQWGRRTRASTITGGGIADRIRAAIRINDPVVLGISDRVFDSTGNIVGAGHELVPIRVRARPLGGAYVDVYDPNQPFQRAVESRRHGTSTIETNSSVEIDAAGSWTFRGLTTTASTDPTVVKPVASRPWQGGGATIDTTAIRGASVAGKDGLSNGVTTFSPVNVTDTAGHSVADVKGARIEPDRDSASRIVRYVLPDDRAWRITGPGAADLAVRLGAWTANVEPRAAGGAGAAAVARPTATYDGRSRTVGVHGAGTEVTSQMTVGGETHTVSVASTNGASVAFARDGAQFSVTGAGHATLRIGGLGGRAEPATAVVPLTLTRGAAIRVRPSRWTARGLRRVAITRNGRRRVVAGRALRLRVRLGTPRVSARARVATVTLRAAVAGTREAGRLVVSAVALRRGRRVIRPVVQTLPLPGGIVKLRLAGLPRGRLVIALGGGAAGTVHGVPASGDASRRVAVTIG